METKRPAPLRAGPFIVAFPILSARSPRTARPKPESAVGTAGIRRTARRRCSARRCSAARTRSRNPASRSRAARRLSARTRTVARRQSRGPASRSAAARSPGTAFLPMWRCTRRGRRLRARRSSSRHGNKIRIQRSPPGGSTRLRSTHFLAPAFRAQPRRILHCHAFDRPPEVLFDRAQHGPVLGRHEGERHALALHAPRAADTVRVRFRRIGDVEIDDV